MTTAQDIDHWVERLWPMSAVLFVLDDGPADQRMAWIETLQPRAVNAIEAADRSTPPPLTLAWSPTHQHSLAHALSSLFGMGGLAARMDQEHEIQAWLSRLTERGTPDAFIVLHGVEGWLGDEHAPESARLQHDRQWLHALLSGGHEHLHVLVALDAHEEPELLAWQNRHPLRAQPQTLKRHTPMRLENVHERSPAAEAPTFKAKASRHVVPALMAAVIIAAAILASRWSA